ncbi:MAG: hypothetical protein ABW252_06885 [Polyangiales bacterium]
MRRVETLGLLCLLSACHGSSVRKDRTTSDDAPDLVAPEPTPEAPVSPLPLEPVPMVPAGAVPATVLPPSAEAAAWPAAPAFDGAIHYVAAPGRVVLRVPAVAGAGDYRVFALGGDVTVRALGEGEQVDGATLFCAGLVQRNQCDQSEAIGSYGPNFRIASCKEDVRAVDVPKTVARDIQIDGLTDKTTLVVEAIDALCPFPGAYGAHHADIECAADGNPVRAATVDGKTVSWRVCPVSVPVRTEAEIRKEYGSLIVNGQGPVPLVSGASPWQATGLPGPARAPKVLRRTVIEVTPRAPAALPAEFTEADFYESFSDPSDQPRKVSTERLVPDFFLVQNPTLFQTKRLNLYSFAAHDPQWHVAQGTMRSVLPDVAQQIMASNVMVPRRAFRLPDEADRYLHVTFEAPTGATQRRYWWLYACGASAAGQTIVDGKLAPEGGIVPTPAFMNALEGQAISKKGWNCLQIVPRSGSYEGVAGGPYRPKVTGAGRPETDLRVVLNRPVASPRALADLEGTVVNVSPSMEGNDPALYGTWLRQWDARKRIAGVLLDDQMYVDQRVRFDVFLSRGRVVLYANGVQKLCNGYAKHRLSMAETAIGVGHVLYHSSVERMDMMREDWLTTGQFHYLHNLSMLDQRSFDNFGVREDAKLPADFQEGQCYEAQ